MHTYLPVDFSSNVDNGERFPINGASIDVFAPLCKAIQAKTVIAGGGIGHLLRSEGQQANRALIRFGVAAAVFVA